MKNSKSVNSERCSSYNCFTGKGLQKSLTDSEISSFKRYQLLVVGRLSLWSLFIYEIFTLFFGGLPGALGLLARKTFYPKLVGTCGEGVVWGRNLVIRHGHKIHIGDNVVFDDNVVLDAKGIENSGIRIGSRSLVSRNTIISCKDGNIIIGDDVSVGINSLIHAVKGSDVNIGDKTVIAAYVYLIGGGTYRIEQLGIPFKDQGIYSKGGIRVENNVWIGANAQILDGVALGEGVIVGASSVVTRSVADNGVVAGVPAKIIRTRGKGD